MWIRCCSCHMQSELTGKERREARWLNYEVRGLPAVWLREQLLSSTGTPSSLYSERVSKCEDPAYFKFTMSHLGNFLSYTLGTPPPQNATKLFTGLLQQTFKEGTSQSLGKTRHLKGGKRCSSRIATLSIFQPCSWWPVHSSTVELCIQSKIYFEVGELPMLPL